MFVIVITGAKPSLSSWWAHREGSSAKLPVPAGAEEEARPSIPSLQQEQGRDTQAPEGSLLSPPNPPAAQEEPLDSSAPHRYHLPVSWVSWAGQGMKLTPSCPLFSLVPCTCAGHSGASGTSLGSELASGFATKRICY